MYLPINESLLLEQVSGSDVADALSNRKAVLITYDDEQTGHTGKRYIEPYVYGETKAGNPCIRAYQYQGDTNTGVPRWKLFRLDRIQSWEETGTSFDLEPQARGWAAEAFNKGGDASMKRVFKIVNLEETPVSDVEKLKARTRQAKQTQPVTLQQMGIKQQPVKQQQQNQTNPWGKLRRMGPVGKNKPTTGTESPNQNQQQPQQQVQVQGQKTTPVETTPKQTGPITKMPMSDDEFKDKVSQDFEQ